MSNEWLQYQCLVKVGTCTHFWYWFPSVNCYVTGPNHRWNSKSMVVFLSMWTRSLWTQVIPGDVCKQDLYEYSSCLCSCSCLRKFPFRFPFLSCFPFPTFPVARGWPQHYKATNPIFYRLEVTVSNSEWIGNSTYQCKWSTDTPTKSLVVTHPLKS